MTDHREMLVEAIARELYRADGDDPPWPNGLEAAKVLYRRDARAVLDALTASPIFGTIFGTMLARALDEVDWEAVFVAVTEKSTKALLKALDDLDSIGLAQPQPGRKK